MRALLRRMYVYKDQIMRAQSDMEPQTLGSMTWRLLAPSYPQLIRAVALADSNLASGIVVIESEGKTVVVGGDAPLEVWEQVQAELPTRSIVRWPHHGGYISSSDTSHQSLLEMLDPEAVLVSVGANNSYGHPSDEFFEAVSEHGTRLLCTQATTKCTGIAGWRCAGSIQIDLTSASGPKLLPARPGHGTFVLVLEVRSMPRLRLVRPGYRGVWCALCSAFSVVDSRGIGGGILNSTGREHTT